MKVNWYPEEISENKIVQMRVLTVSSYRIMGQLPEYRKQIVDLDRSEIKDFEAGEGSLIPVKILSINIDNTITVSHKLSSMQRTQSRIGYFKARRFHQMLKNSCRTFGIPLPTGYQTYGYPLYKKSGSALDELMKLVNKPEGRYIPGADPRLCHLMWESVGGRIVPTPGKIEL